MVERHMDITFSIHHHADDIVCIGDIPFVLRALQGPCGLIQFSLAQHQIAFGVIIRDVLCIAIGHQRTVPEHRGIDRCMAVSLAHTDQLGICRGIPT